MCLDYIKRLVALWCFQIQYFMLWQRWYHVPSVHVAKAREGINPEQIRFDPFKGQQKRTCQTKANKKKTGKVVEPVPHKLAIMRGIPYAPGRMTKGNEDSKAGLLAYSSKRPRILLPFYENKALFISVTLEASDYSSGTSLGTADKFFLYTRLQ